MSGIAGELAKLTVIETGSRPAKSRNAEPLL